MDYHYWVTLAYNQFRVMLIKKLTLLLRDSQEAEDCVSYSFMYILNKPLNNVVSLGEIHNYLQKTSYHKALSILQHKKMLNKDTKVLTEYMYADELPKNVSNYYPLDKRLIEGISKLTETNQILVISYMNDLPINKVAKSLGLNDTSVYEQLQYIFKQLRRYMEGREEVILVKQALIASNRRSEVTDKIYSLKQKNWSFKAIADHFGVPRNQIIKKYYKRIKMMEKYPEVYKDIIVKTA